MNKKSCSKINYSHACLGIILAAPPSLTHCWIQGDKKISISTSNWYHHFIWKSALVPVPYRSLPVGEQVMSMCDSSKEYVLSSCSSRFHQIVNWSSRKVRLLRLEMKKWQMTGGCPNCCFAVLVVKRREKLHCSTASQREKVERTQNQPPTVLAIQHFTLIGLLSCLYFVFFPFK